MIYLDFEKPLAEVEGKAEELRALARKADVIVENFKVGDLQRYGLDYASVAATNPRAVYVSITGYGQTGPRAHEAGYDGAMQAFSGLMAMLGEPGRAPVKLSVAWIDVLTGVHAAVGALAALRRRERVGEGAHLDVSLFDVALASTDLDGELPTDASVWLRRTAGRTDCPHAG